ncbi:hypothetical protein FFLO_00523 [Filobasidium floriforme]|uniref:Uncharacterized protein n=1 Tax=Filobasidium floriforme TaxID=5210 RepID=A0A8K0JRA3_9TREE|nr:hypothetical protein FFLO_00523 [Filobasidium floriforme]
MRRPGASNKKGIGLVETRRAVRLPNSSRLRPTTLQETITPIVVKHTLRLTVYHSVWGQDAKGQSLSTGRCRTMRQVQVSHPVTILPVSRKRARALSLSLSLLHLYGDGASSVGRNQS